MTRILLVIDAPPERRMIARLCPRLELIPVEVATLAAARQLLRDPTRDFSAAVVDAQLRDGQGLALLGQLRVPPLPCAMVLAGGDELEAAAPLALSLGVHRLLRKPFSTEGFEAAVESAKKRSAEMRRWLNPETVGERHDSWLKVLMATDSSGDEQRGSAPGFLDRMARMVVAQGQLTPAEARLVPDLLLGRDYNSVAAVHGLSAETVRSHVKAILAKLNLASAKQLWQVCVAELDG
ncbi:response regulator FixJ [Enhygromyxa salina]|uniref:Response regulator FixJ n=1 Tax=Enhygromyxa salina TaxID=215803 RepID=A0A2S9XFH8_9BACT|nr:LuxR C-terminal-related transcriptional regulator [Enhygromyxa salina]PRP91431.1 response regulator FixJ [Enhygromyxa salina]